MNDQCDGVTTSMIMLVLQPELYSMTKSLNVCWVY